MTALILKAIVLLTSIIIVRFAEPALNSMDRSSPWLLRLAFFILGTGALAQIIWLFCETEPDWRGALVSLGVALLLLAERRKEKHHA